MLAQIACIAVDDVTKASVVAALGSNQQPVAIDRARIDRQIRELALEHAAGLLGDDAYLTRLTPAAYAHGFAFALPEKAAMARPTGFKRGDAIHIRIPIATAANRLNIGAGA